ncbi:MAG: phosphoheptose isomerase [Saprospiraceae bacterium]
MSTESIKLEFEVDPFGHRLSPVLNEKIKNYLIDIDGTICDDIPNEESERMKTALPYENAREFINKWYEQGHIITFFTSRTESLRQITDEWLKQHHFKYHGILMGKPRGGNYHWIDNHVVKSTLYIGKFTDFVIEKQEVEVFKD